MVARDWYAVHGLRSLYAVPIAYQDSVVGVLVLLGGEPFDFESEEYEILEALIAEAGAAIRNSRLTDVVMPHMSGPELARRILELRPRTKVVYMSGYTDDALGHHGVLDPDIILLPKPFTRESLMQHVQRALDGGTKRD